jgi:hypothetical protein
MSTNLHENQFRMAINTFKYQLVLLLLLSRMISFSQINNNGSVSILEPNVASFAKFIDNPVNTFNGSADVTIPVYTLRNGQIEIPIALRYNTSGIKVSEEASMVGLGWNLNVGGIITQNIVGVLDTPLEYNNLERITPNMYVPGPSEHWYWQHQYNVPIVYPFGLFSEIIGFFIDPMVNDACDATNFGKGQPDIYYFSFGGYSGKFFIDYRDGSIHIMENDQDIKFSNYQGNDGHKYWKALTPDGTWFYFQLKTATNNGYDFGSLTYHLTKVVFPNGKILNYEYEKIGEAALPIQQSSFYKQDIQSHTPLFSKTYYSGSSYSTTTYEVVALNQIKFENSHENVNFFYSDREDNIGEIKLDSIVVSDNISTLEKTFLFDYGYFISSVEGNVWDDGASLVRRKRLKLLSFGEESKPKYNFRYSGIELPSKLSYAQDYWGYYNGKTDNTSLLANFWSFFHLDDPPPAEMLPWTFIAEGGSRVCDTNYVEAGTLSEIEYPTGGHMSIEYESNSFTNHYYPCAAQIEEYHQIIDAQTVDTAASHERFLDNTSEYKYYPFDIETTSKVDINCTFNWDTRYSNYQDINGAYVKVATRHPVENYPLETIKIVNVYYQENPPIHDSMDEFTLEPGHYGLYPLLPPQGEPGNRLTVQADINIQPVEFVFPDDFGSISYGGGIRVKSIKQIDKDKLDLYTKYDYQNGKLMTPLVLYTSNEQKTFEYYYTEWGDLNWGFKNFYYVNKLTSSNIPVSYDAGGGLVGYPEVIIRKVSDTPTENNGFEKYSYNWSLPLHSLTLPNIPSPINGKIDRHQIFNAKGIEVFQKKLDYQIEELHRYYGFTPNWNREYGNILRYSLISNRINLSKTTELYFDETGEPYGEKVIDYTYNSSNFLQSVTENTSDNNKTIITNNIYVADLENPSQLHLDMIAMNRISPLISKTISINENGSLIDKYKIEYEYDYLPTVSLYDADFFPTISSEIVEYPTGDINKATVTELNYDNMGNIIEITKQNEQKICYIWGYNNESPIAKSTNATLSESGHTSFENNELNGWTKYDANSYVTNPENVFTGKGAISVTGNGPFQIFTVGSNAEKHSGYKASVWIKGQGAYIQIEVNGQSATHVKATNEFTDGLWHKLEVELPRHKIQPYFTQGENLKIKVYTGGSGLSYFDDIRFHPSDAQMTTYTHEPLIGVTSISNESNKPEFYIYDPFGRLELIKDFERNIVKKNDYHYRAE